MDTGTSYKSDIKRNDGMVVAERQRDIPAQANQMGKNIEHLEHLLEALEARLMPVLSSAEPMPNKDEAKAPQMCDHAVWLASVAERLRLICSHVDSMRSRVEL